MNPRENGLVIDSKQKILTRNHTYFNSPIINKNSPNQLTNMARPSARLENLAVELVIRIAQECTCDDVINLSMASRRLFASCRNWSVFEQIIRRNHARRNRKSDWDPAFLTAQTHQDIWSRCALADKEFVISSWTTNSLGLSRDQLLCLHPSLSLLTVSQEQR